jgi:hypothetical protein
MKNTAFRPNTRARSQSMIAARSSKNKSAFYFREEA